MEDIIMKKVYIKPTCGTFALKVQKHLLGEVSYDHADARQRDERYEDYEDYDNDPNDFDNVTFWDD